jgi:8-oxo-dGTP diphosphatase
MIDVSCAVIRNEELKVLIVQRGEKSDHPFMWEFPGGKVVAGETSEDSVVREVFEELEMDIVIVGTLNPVEYDYGHKQIRLIPFICDTLNERPVLKEHIDYQWIFPSDMNQVGFSQADVYVAEQYMAPFSDARVKLVNGNREPVNEAGQSSDAVSDEELKSMVYRMMGSSEVGWIAASAAENKTLFRKLLDFTSDHDPRIVFRSSWALTKVCEQAPDLFLPLLPVVVDKLFTVNNGSAERSFLKILTLTGTSSLDEDKAGLLVDYCFSMLRSPVSAIAIKAYSMDVLHEISTRYPELTHELAAILSMLPEDVSAGIKAKSRALIKKLASPPGNGGFKN